MDRFLLIIQSISMRWITMVTAIDEFLDRSGNHLSKKEWKIYPSLLGALLFIGISLGILILMPTQISIQPGQTITARTFPTLLTYIMLGCALLNFGKDLIQIFLKKSVPYVYLSALTEIRSLILLSLMIGYALLIPVIGFIGGSVFYGISMLLFFRIKKLHYYLVVICTAISIGYLFKYILYVRLP